MPLLTGAWVVVEKSGAFHEPFSQPVENQQNPRSWFMVGEQIHREQETTNMPRLTAL